MDPSATVFALAMMNPPNQLLAYKQDVGALVAVLAVVGKMRIPRSMDDYTSHLLRL